MAEPQNLIVLRYSRVTHHQLGAIEAHGKRLGDVAHVDTDRSHLNEFLIGHAGLTDIADAHVVQMQRANGKRR